MKHIAKWTLMLVLSVHTLGTVSATEEATSPSNVKHRIESNARLGFGDDEGPGEAGSRPLRGDVESHNGEDSYFYKNLREIERKEDRIHEILRGQERGLSPREEGSREEEESRLLTKFRDRERRLRPNRGETHRDNEPRVPRVSQQEQPERGSLHGLGKSAGCREAAAGIQGQREKDVASLSCNVKELAQNFTSTKEKIAAEGLNTQNWNLLFEGAKGIDRLKPFLANYSKEHLGISLNLSGQRESHSSLARNEAVERNASLETIKKSLGHLADKLSRLGGQILDSLPRDFYSSSRKKELLSHYMKKLSNELESWKKAVLINQSEDESTRGVADSQLWPSSLSRCGNCNHSYDYSCQSFLQPPQTEGDSDL